MKIVECVPNFSEGKDRGIIDKITKAIESVEDVELKDVDMGADMNRTVVTFVGDPKGVKEAAFRAIKMASELIDMSKHKGSHPRMGATDVCPFVPVTGVTMEDCIQIAKEVGERVGSELGIPIYLYEEAATEEKRRNLASVRSGEYEGLKDKLVDPKWKPDFGPAGWDDRVEHTGATAIGAREFLIAYNINLNTRNAKIAWDIAFELRDRGRSKRVGGPDGHYWKGDIERYSKERFPCGECDHVAKTFEEVRTHTEKEHGYDLKELLEKDYDYDVSRLEGKAVKKKGKFDHCKAIGWYVEEFKRAQISINLTNYKKTSVHEVYEEAKRLASDMGVSVTGSEIVGIVPFQAMMDSGRYYLEKQGQPTGVPWMDVIETAVQSLGLRDVTDFHIETKVIGAPYSTDTALVSMKVDEFVHEVSRDSSTPGGGSIAALAGSLGAGLCSMVCNLSTGGRGTEDVDEILMPVADRIQDLKDALVRAVDEDTSAFDSYMDAKRMPDSTPEQKELRRTRMFEGLKVAVEVPLETARRSFEVMELLVPAAKYGKKGALSDAVVGAQMAYSGVIGGIENVKINLEDMDDKDYADEVLSQCEEIKQNAWDKLVEIQDIVNER